MNRIRDYISAHLLIQLIETEESWTILIRKEEATFAITVPLKVQELFWKVDEKNETIFEDWNDYYDGSPDELKKQKEEDCIKLMDSFTNLESFRIETEGKIMKTKNLLILRDGKWKDLTEEIWGEPGIAHNGGKRSPLS